MKQTLPPKGRPLPSFISMLPTEVFRTNVTTRGNTFYTNVATRVTIFHTNAAIRGKICDGNDSTREFVVYHYKRNLRPLNQYVAPREEAVCGLIIDTRAKQGVVMKK